MSEIITIEHIHVPMQTAGTLARYLIHHIRPGSFIEAVLCNDLFDAARRADAQNFVCLGEIVKLIANHFPMGIYGRENYRAWLRNEDKEYHEDVQRRFGDRWTPYLY